MNRTLLALDSQSQTPGKPSRLLRTQFSHQLYKTPGLNEDIHSRQLLLTNQYASDFQNYQYEPKRRSTSLLRSSSASKHHIFQNAKTPNKHQRLRSTSVKTLMLTQPLTNVLNKTQRPSKKQLQFTIPSKSTTKHESKIINEKKTVEDIMNRLKNKKENRLKIVKEIKTQEQTNTLVNTLEHLVDFNQLSKGAITISNQKEFSAKKREMQKKQDKQVKQKEEMTRLRQIESQKQREKQMEKVVKQMLQEKSKSLQKTQLQVNNKLQLIQNIMNNFQQTLKTKEKTLSEKQLYLKQKQQQIELKINQAAKNIQLQINKNSSAINHQNNNHISKNDNQSSISHPKTIDVKLNTISPRQSRVDQQKFFPSPSNKYTSINNDEPQERFNYNTIESGNDEERKITFRQEDREPGLVRTATFNRYNASDMVDLDHIETVHFKALQEPPKIGTQITGDNTSNNSKRPASSAKNTIKTTKQYPFSGQETTKPSYSAQTDSHVEQVLSISYDVNLKKQISKDFAQDHKPSKNSNKNLDKSLDNNKQLKERQRQVQYEKQREKQKERQNEKERQQDKQRQRLKRIEKEKEDQKQRQRQRLKQKQRQQLEKQKQKEKKNKDNQIQKQKNRKPSMNSQISQKSKQETEEAKQKKRQEKQKIAQIVKVISRVNELVYFIGEIPHHCSNNMKKKKKYTFKLASLYLLKYVFDKFRYLTRLCQDLLKKKAVTKQYIQERQKQNHRIKQSYEKMKSYVYKKQPFPPKDAEKHLDQNSPHLCIDDKLFVKGIMFREIKSIIGFYHDDTEGKWTDHQVNLCYYRMFLAVFILEEIEFGNVVLDTEGQDYPDYMLGEIDNFTEEELREKMAECYEIFLDLDVQ